MPDIDVSDLCDDTDIADEPFAVVRRQQVMQTNGTATIVTDAIPATGSLTPTGDNSLVREEAYTTQSNSVKVITTFRLRGAGKDSAGNSYLADLIVDSDGNTFIVKDLKDWSKFGTGFIEADCISYDFNPIAPT